MDKLPFKLKIDSAIEQWRADTFWTKEPETLDWIDSFEKYKKNQPIKHEKILTFWDIGANVGLYSLYAAQKYPWLRVVSFEPMLFNYLKLLTNIAYNKLENIYAVHGAMGFAPSYTYFLNNSSACGSSDGRIINNQYKASVDAEFAFDPTYQTKAQKENATMKIRRQVMEYTMDQWACAFGAPDFVKIDIDGGEYDSFIGGAQTLKKGIPKLLIEFDRKHNLFRFYINYLKSIGYSEKRFDHICENSTVRRTKEKIDERNFIFEFKNTVVTSVPGLQ